MKPILQQSALDIRADVQQKQQKSWYSSAQHAIRQYNLKKSLQNFKNNLAYSHKQSMLNMGFNFHNPGFLGGLGGVAVGGWKELGRTTLGSPASTISVSSLANKRYLMILHYGGRSASSQSLYRLNADASNYSDRYSINGAADGTDVSQTSIAAYQTSATNLFGIHNIANFTTTEKLSINHTIDQSTAGSGTAPARREMYAKWVDTTNPISSVDFVSSSDNYTIDSEVVVLGYDPADTHTDNFWTELDSVTASGSSTTFASNTFAAKKYLWIQTYLTGMTADVNTTFNGDTSAAYARRYSVNGGADGTGTSVSNISNMTTLGSSTPAFCNIFIINVSAREKLVIAHTVSQNTAGAGTAPQRIEMVSKWANTASQITSITHTSTTGNFGSNSIMKIWGSD